MNQRTRQLEYELASDAQAAATRLEQYRAAAVEGDLNAPRAARFIANAFRTVREHIQEAQSVKTRGTGGKFKGWLRRVPSDVAAVLALRTCVELCSRSNKATTLTYLASELGRRYELEVKIKEAEEVNPVYMEKVTRRIKNASTKSVRHIRGAYLQAYKVVLGDHANSSLTQAEQIHLGKFGIQACMDAGIIVQERSWGAKGQLITHFLAPEVAEFLLGYGERDVAQVIDHSATAMTCPPDPWTNLTDGGYLSLRRKAVSPLMSLFTIRESEREGILQKFTAERMPLVFQVANYLQSIPYTLHDATIAAVRRVWEAGGGVLGVPSKNGPKAPPFPFPEDWELEVAPEAEKNAFYTWKARMVQYYDEGRTWRGKLRELRGLLRATKQDYDRLWFPTYVDKRNRWYYRGMPNPQGSDMSKAILHYADKKPLGERGLFWLKVHIANSFGFDKERMSARAQWTDDNWEGIQRALEAPEDFPEVWGTDAPWCMYSAAYELNQAYLSGNPLTYETGIIVHKDATCSGLQHFSAMLRDPVGGKYVNLTDDMVGPKMDIYMQVAYNATKAAERDATSSDPDLAVPAKWWLKVGIPRGLSKKPTMTYVYGATLIGAMRYVEDFVEKEMGESFPEGYPRFLFAMYMARKLFYGIAATVPAAAAAMQWLKSVAQNTPKGQRMTWTTPLGFIVQHDYRDYDEIRVRVKSCGIDRVVVREFNDDTRPRQMQNAIAPNFVHSLDATHLAFTALLMQQHNLCMTGIHDSFGTHACDVDVLDTAIRGAFYNLYTSYNPMESFLQDVGGVGSTPNQGTLDISKVLTSEFFFS